VNERLNHIEKSSPELSVEIQGVGSRCDDIDQQIVVHTDDISKVAQDLKELKDKVDQQPPAPVFKNSDSPCSVLPSVPAAAVPPSVLAAAPPNVPAAVPSVPAQPTSLDSLIVSEYPPLFEEFRTKTWTVLWRGSRDGFTAEEFHRRCDGHENTLTLILDTDGNVFGGFTPVEWDSREWNWRYGDESNCFKGDDSLRSFLFTLRNPHGVPPRKFALKEEKKEKAIGCISERCAIFGGEIGVDDNGNTGSRSCTYIGTNDDEYDHVYTNDVDFEDFFTGALGFTVKEIEVFEIAN
jgi:hypothetical protein